MSSDKDDLRCETDTALTEPWIDVLGKTLAGGIPRRTALKILAGVALGSVFGITAGCGSSSNLPTCPESGPCEECIIGITGPASCNTCNDVGTLCSAADKYSPYKQLFNYLAKQGFSAQEVARSPGKRDVSVFHLIETGELDTKGLGLSFTNSTNSHLNAELYYLQVQLPYVQSIATAIIFQDEIVKYGVYVSPDGQITTEHPPTETSTPPTPNGRNYLETVALRSTLSQSGINGPPLDEKCNARCKHMCARGAKTCIREGAVYCTKFGGKNLLNCLSNYVKPCYSPNCQKRCRNVCDCEKKCAGCQMCFMDSASERFSCKDVDTRCPDCGYCVASDCIPRSFTCPPNLIDYKTCECKCEPGYTKCNGKCVDLKNDDYNCGSCGHGCFGACNCTGDPCDMVCCNGVCKKNLGSCAEYKYNNNCSPCTSC